MGAILADTHSGANYMCGGEVPPPILAFLGSISLPKEQRINQCELLALVSAVFSFSHLLRGRNVVVWVDNVATLKAVVDGHCHARKWPFLPMPFTSSWPASTCVPISSTSRARPTPLIFPVECPLCPMTARFVSIRAFSRSPVTSKPFRAQRQHTTPC